MKLPTYSLISGLFAVLLLSQSLLPGEPLIKSVVRVENVYLQPDEIPKGWHLISSECNSEVYTRIIEVRLKTELSSIWTQRFESQGKLIEIEYLGGLTEDAMAKAYSEIARQKKADAVCHKARFAIAIYCESPELIQTAIRALHPDPIDRVKLFNADLPLGQQLQSEALANSIQRESIGKHLDIMPRSVLNQFFEGASLRQITYVECGSVEDASKAYARAKEMSGGANLVLRERNFVVEIIADNSWGQRVRPIIEANLLAFAAAEEKRLAAEAEQLAAVRALLLAATPTNTPTKLRHLR